MMRLMGARPGALVLRLRQPPRWSGAGVLDRPRAYAAVLSAAQSLAGVVVSDICCLLQLALLDAGLLCCAAEGRYATGTALMYVRGDTRVRGYALMCASL